jgi:5'-3' exonuclease
MNNTLKIDNSEPVLLIDFSYYIIYRFFALQSWFKISETVFDEDLFLTKYKALFLSHLTKIIKKTNIKSHNVILVGDCTRSNIWRMDLFSQYKGNRDKLQEKSPINKNIFPIIYDDIVPSLKEKGIQFVCIDKLEADDVIYHITKNISNNITIITNDNDYLQMVKENISIVNLPSLKSITNRGLGCAKSDLLNKILCGDPSDNIPSIVGKKQATKLLKLTSEELDTYILENDFQDKFDLNSTLIDMKNIPCELCENIKIEIY